MASNLRQLEDSCLLWSTILVLYGIMRTGFSDDQRDSSPTLTALSTVTTVMESKKGRNRNGTHVEVSTYERPRLSKPLPND